MKFFLDEPIEHFQPSLALPEGDPLLFAFQGERLVVQGADTSVPTLQRALALGLELEETSPLGTLAGRPCVVGVVARTTPLPEPLETKALRRLFGQLDFSVLGVAALASQIAHFLSTNRHCGSCGARTKTGTKERSLRCDRCERDIYPAVAPCVIVLVHDGPRVLLTRQPRFPKGMYGLVAGFVEPGESFEACAHREIKEEVGLDVTDLRYVASQPWPFPSQLMIGMTARYAGGELVVDSEELEEAAWFDLDALPMIPPPFSIGRHLIDLHRDAVRGP